MEDKYENPIVTVVDLKRLNTHGSAFLSGTGCSKINSLRSRRIDYKLGAELVLYFEEQHLQ